jgi:hypothetical protein
VNKQILSLLFLFFSCAAWAQTDSSKATKLGREYFVEDLTSKINVSLFTYNAKNSFSYDSKGKIDYQPNEYLGFGIKVMHKWLGLAYVYAPTNLQEKTKGTTKYSNFTLNSYGKKIGLDFYYLKYDGYYIANTNQIPELRNNNKPYLIRPDISTTNIGSNLYYIFNHKKYSYRSTFLQNEIQKHSAGSFMINGSFSYYNINADSSIVPTYLGPGNKVDADASIRKGDFYSICLMPGYAHTFVIKERFFITISAFFGANFQQQQYYVGKELVDRNKFIVAPKASGRVGLGYNGKRFYAGVAAIGDNYTLPLGANEKLNYLMGNGTFYFGIRFNTPKALQKFSSFMDKVPGVLIQRVN